MKTIKLITVIAAVGFIYSCSKSSETTEPTPPPTPIGTVTYEKNIKAILADNCASRCHSATGTKQQPYLDTYQLAKDNSNLIINKIELPAGSPGIMPPKSKLDQNTIDIIKAWRTQGFTN
jgi:hypothetical protein